MNEIDIQIKQHEDQIKILCEQLKNSINLEDKFNISNNITKEKDFIISLLKIKDSFTINNEEKESIINIDKNQNEKNNCKNNNEKKHKKDKKEIMQNSYIKDIKDNNDNHLCVMDEVEENNFARSSFYYDNDKNKISTKFLKKYEKGNFIYFECNKRRAGCKGKCKFNKSTKMAYMIEECNKDIIHDNRSFEMFYDDFKKNNIKNYNMFFKKYQEYFVKVLFLENKAKNFNDIIREFSKSYKNNFILTQKEVNDIKYLTIGKNNNLDFFSIM